MIDEKEQSAGDGTDDTYVLEDTGETLADFQDSDDAAAPSGNAPTEAQAGDAQQWKDRYLRGLADFDNYRKRADREKQEFRRYALADTIKDLLPVLDNFDRALAHAADDELRKGVLMIHKQLFDVLQKHGLKVIDDSDVAFDPNVHEAVVRDENPNVPSHTVVEVLQKGYFLNERLLRPALVRVAVGGPDRQVSH